MQAKAFAPIFFRVIASTCDSVIFIYIGLAVFSFEQSFHWGLVLVSVAAIVIARATNIYGLSAVINFCGRRAGASKRKKKSFVKRSAPPPVQHQEPEPGLQESSETDAAVAHSSSSSSSNTSALAGSQSQRVPFEYQHMLAFSGLRGAIAFALALRAKDDYAVRTNGEIGAGGAILTTTLVIIIFTVLVLGGSTQYVMGALLGPADAGTLSRNESSASSSSRGGHDRLHKLDGRLLKPLLLRNAQHRAETPAAGGAEGTRGHDYAPPGAPSGHNSVFSPTVSARV